jgi:hypothetical protein
MEWIKIGGIALTVIFVVEIDKWIHRRKMPVYV